MTRNNSVFANYGFPFKLSEYLATGNIVMATKVGDVCLYLKDRYDAYLLNPESAKAIADTIIEIAQNPQKAIAVAQKGLETMKQKFSINHIGPIFIDFLSKI